jgi:hypothetical protein
VDCGLHLCKFGLDKFGFTVALGVIFGKDSIGLVAAIFGDEPTGTFRDKPEDRILASYRWPSHAYSPDESYLHERGAHL